MHPITHMQIKLDYFIITFSCMLYHRNRARSYPAVWLSSKKRWCFSLTLTPYVSFFKLCLDPKCLFDKKALVHQCCWNS